MPARRTPPPERMPHSVALVLLPGHLDSSVGITLDLLRSAQAVAAGLGQPVEFRVSLVSPVAGGPRSAAGLEARTLPLQAARGADLVLLPGAYLEGAAQMAAWIAAPWARGWLDFVAGGGLEGACVAASCAGTWALAEAGLLDGRDATTVWWLASEFGRRYPRVRLDLRSIVVDDGPVITAGAALAHTDLMLHLIARLAGTEVAETCSRLLLADRRELQSRHTHLAWMTQSDPLLRQLQRWIERHLHEPIGVGDLARAVHLTPRTLARRCRQQLGLSPWRMVQRQRLEAAQRLLRGSTLPFDAVAARVGYVDPTALRRLLKRELGLAPAALRPPARGCAG